MAGGDELTPTAEAAIARLRSRLGPTWTVTVRTTPPGRVNIDLAHDLTTDSSVGLPNDDGDHLGFVEQFLASREIGVIGKAPRDVANASLIRRLRDVAAANGWSAETLGVVAAVLEGEKILSFEEALWLGEAGPAWAS